MPYEVAIVQRRLTQYRVPLFERMRAILQDEGIALRVLHGQPSQTELSKNDGGSLAWAEILPTRYLADGRICWQPFMADVARSDLVIVTQENKLVNNLLALCNPWRNNALAFWGHGRNMQAAKPDGVRERFKRWTTNRVDWWFAYTELSASFVQDDGFPAARITVLNNSIDTATLRDSVTLARTQSVGALRRKLGLQTVGPLAVFLGSLYADKRINFLLQAADAIHHRVPGFQLAIAGAGPDRDKVLQAIESKPFIKYLGQVNGSKKAELLAAADLMLNPGLVGLGILDAFVASLPMLTTNCNLHSPEISYLRNGSNGLMTSDDQDAYVAATVRLLADPNALQALRDGALKSSAEYSIEAMARRFCDGIHGCLNRGSQEV